MTKSKEETRAHCARVSFSVFYRRNPPSAYPVRLSVGCSTILRKFCSVTGMFGGGGTLRCGWSAGAFIWVHAPNIPAKSNPVGGHSICPRCMEVHSNNRRWEQACAIRRTKRKFRTTGGETPPLQILAFVRRGRPKAPLREGGGAVRRQEESAQLRNSFLFWIPPAKLWVRQLYNFPHFAKIPQSRALPQAPLAPAPSRREP